MHANEKEDHRKEVEPFLLTPPELRAAVKEIKRKTVELNYILPQKGTMSSAKNMK